MTFTFLETDEAVAAPVEIAGSGELNHICIRSVPGFVPSQRPFIFANGKSRELDQIILCQQLPTRIEVFYYDNVVREYKNVAFEHRTVGDTLLICDAHLEGDVEINAIPLTVKELLERHADLIREALDEYGNARSDRGQNIGDIAAAATLLESLSSLPAIATEVPELHL